MKKWKVEKKCDNCPFHESGPGRQLRDDLMPGRFDGITCGLLNGEHFFCHKTTNDDDGWDEESGDYVGGGLVCAGALEFQDVAGVSSQYVRVCRRLDALKRRKDESDGKPRS